MKKLSETLTELGIDFTFPIIIKEANGHVTYYEDSYDFWCRYEYDANGNETYREFSDGYWCKRERDANGNVTYYEESDDYWEKYERDEKGNVTYYEDSNGVTRGTPRSAKTCEGKVMELDGVKYKLTTIEEIKAL